MNAAGLSGMRLEVTPTELRIAVIGDFDASTGRDLEAAARALVAEPRLQLSIDLSQTSYFDAASCTTIIKIANDLDLDTGRLIIERPPPLVQRILDLTRLADRATLRVSTPDSEAVRAYLDPLEAHAYDRLLQAAYDVAVTTAAGTLEGVDSVSLTVKKDSGLRTVASSKAEALICDEMQYQLHEGPCVDAAMTGEMQLLDSLSGARWPRFTASLHERDLHSVLSTPIRNNDFPVGALNIYAREPDRFSEADEAVVGGVVGRLSFLIEEAENRTDSEHVTAALGVAHRERDVIARAQGLLMERHQVDESQALSLLLERGRETKERIADVAARLTAREPETRS